MSTYPQALYNERPSMDYGLYLIDEKLKDFSKSLEGFNLFSSEHDWVSSLNRLNSDRTFTGNPLIDEQL